MYYFVSNKYSIFLDNSNNIFYLFTLFKSLEKISKLFQKVWKD